jgi:hypothetical protein
MRVILLVSAREAQPKAEILAKGAMGTTIVTVTAVTGVNTLQTTIQGTITAAAETRKHQNPDPDQDRP